MLPRFSVLSTFIYKKKTIRHCICAPYSSFYHPFSLSQTSPGGHLSMWNPIQNVISRACFSSTQHANTHIHHTTLQDNYYTGLRSCTKTSHTNTNTFIDAIQTSHQQFLTLLFLIFSLSVPLWVDTPRLDTALAPLHQPITILTSFSFQTEPANQPPESRAQLHCHLITHRENKQDWHLMRTAEMSQ